MKITSLICVGTLLLSGCKATDAMKTLEEYGFPTANQTNESSTGTKVAGGLTGCAVGGAAGYIATKAFSDKMAEEGYTAKEIKTTALTVGALGCVIGGKIALQIIKNMDEKSKQAQEDAWKHAQAQTETVTTSSPQAWSTETHKGTVTIINPETTSAGQQCATRRNYIKTAEGEAEQFIPVCKNSSGVYEHVQA